MRPTRPRVAVVLAGLLAVACGDAAGVGEPGAQPPTTAVADATALTPAGPTPLPVGADATFTLELRGDVAVPPGDPDARGSADLLFDLAAGEVCYRVTVEGADASDAMHVHAGVVGETGPVVLELTAPEAGAVDTCSAADPAALQAVVEAPEDHYLDIHDASHPDGALRAQFG